MPQILTISLAGVVYTLTLFWSNADMGNGTGGWVMNIGDTQNNPIINGIPLVTGADLLAQYSYMNFGVALFIQSAPNPDDVPTFTTLGSSSTIFFAPLK